MDAERTVWWFSGTGNCLCIARELAKSLQARLEPMTKRLDGSATSSPGGEHILVFPVYFGSIPAIVARFAAAITDDAPSSVTAIATYGGGAGESNEQIEEILARRGLHLRSRYGMHLPQNAFSKPWERSEALFARALGRIPRIAEQIEAGTPVEEYDLAFLRKMLAGSRLKLQALYRKTLLESAGMHDDPALTNRDLLGPSDRSYRAGPACTGCGLCERLCPVGNIEIRAGKPEWLGRCEACLSCYHHCPSRAISGGLAARGYFYRNPLIDPEELESQSPHCYAVE
jgi:formate hydrogenlyase subunit 6/NADH:ubiquinone oxidoreductase subunit I